MSSALREIAAQQLKEIEANIRLLVVHPNVVAQHQILTLLLDTDNLAYLRLSGAGLRLADLDSQLDEALRLQGAADPASLKRVVLDEVDRAQVDGLESWLTSLLSRMPNAQIVVLSRQVADTVMRSAALRAQTRFIPTDAALLPDYARRDGDTALLEVCALGTGRVLLNGRSVDNWDGMLPRNLFFYLVDRGMITRSQIFETFWPNLSTREATNVFHVTKRKISEVLGLDLTVYWSGFYHISSKISLIYDVALFSERVQASASAAPDKATELLSEAIALYQGHFQTGTELAWAQKRRQELQQSYGEALIGLAKLREQAGKTREALGLYIRAASTNPQREDLARSIMILYRDLDMHADAIATYRRLEKELDRSLGISPSRSLQELVAEIQQDTREIQRVPAQSGSGE